MSNLFKNKPVNANKKNEYKLPEVRPRRTVEQEIESGRLVEMKNYAQQSMAAKTPSADELKQSSLTEAGYDGNRATAIKAQLLLGANAGKKGSNFRDIQQTINQLPQPLRHPFIEPEDFDVVEQNLPPVNSESKSESKGKIGFPEVNPFVADHAMVHKAITKEDCEKIIAWKNDPNYGMQEGTISGIIKEEKFEKQREEIKKTGAFEKLGYKDMDDFDSKYRVCNIYYDKRAVTGQIEEGSILNNIIEGIMNFNQENFKFNCGGVLAGEWPTLFEYNVGGKYDWHIDVFHTETTPVPACRKISMTVMLSESKDYDGGKLEFQGSPAVNEMNQGDICLFPSYLPHRITPVTRGQRNVLVGWIHGPSWK